MPIVRIQLAEGRSGQEKAALMKAVTEAIHTTLDAPLPTIHVMVQEIPAEDIMVAGETLTSTPKTERI
jgi:4-oxalocrotonate tautomerase